MIIIIGSIFRLARRRTVLLIRGIIAVLSEWVSLVLSDGLSLILSANCFIPWSDRKLLKFSRFFSVGPLASFGRGVLPVGRVAGRLGGRHGTRGVRVLADAAGLTATAVSAV